MKQTGYCSDLRLQGRGGMKTCEERREHATIRKGGKEDFPSLYIKAASGWEKQKGGEDQKTMGSRKDKSLRKGDWTNG